MVSSKTSQKAVRFFEVMIIFLVTAKNNIVIALMFLTKEKCELFFLKKSYNIILLYLKK